MTKLSTHDLAAQKIEFLKRVALFKGLLTDPQAFAALAHLMTVQEFPAGHVLLKEGELGNEFFVLLTGSVSIFRRPPDGEPYKVAILTAEKTPALGEGGLVEAEPRSATVVCDEVCQLLVLSRENFGQFCASHPQWAVPVLKQIATLLMARVRQVSMDVMLLHRALMNEIRG